MGADDHPKNTFPIDPGDTRSVQLRAVSRSPSSWVGAVAALGSLIFLPLWVGVPCVGAILGGLAWYWRGRWGRLEEAAERHVIARSNAEQDQSLARGIKQLREWDYDDYAGTLSRILDLKQVIEAGIHRQPVRLSADEEVEKLVDTLCAEVRADLFKMADIRYTLHRRKRRRRLSRERVRELEEALAEMGERVSRAVAVVDETRAQLSDVIGPIETDLGANPVLDDAIARLKEETRFAKRVRERIQSTMDPDLEHLSETVVAPAPMVSE